MTKEQLIDLIRERLPDNIEWHEGIIEKNISMAFNQIFYDTFRKDSANLDLYCKTYLQDVLYEENTDTYYSVLPVVSIVQFPDPADGVRRIQREKGIGVEFIPITGNMGIVSDDDEILAQSEIIGYRVTNGRIEYRWMNPRITKVKMDVVRTFESYDWTEQIYIPSGKDEQLISLIINFLQGQPMKDLVNDNNPITK